VADYVPVTFYKDGQTEVAEKIGEYVQLMYEGWSPNGPAPEPDPFSIKQREALTTSYARFTNEAGETIPDRSARIVFNPEGFPLDIVLEA